MELATTPVIENPADELSRGLLPTDLINQTRWWKGRQCLSEFPNRWPILSNPVGESTTAIEEAGKVTLTSIIAPEDQLPDQLFTRYSAYTKLRRTVAYYLKYINALRVAARTTIKSSSRILLTADLEAADRRSSCPITILFGRANRWQEFVEVLLAQAAEASCPR